MQLEDIKLKSYKVTEENIILTDKNKVSEEKLAGTKIIQSNLKKELKEKDAECQKNKEAALMFDSLREDKRRLESKLNEITKTFKNSKSDIE